MQIKRANFEYIRSRSRWSKHRDITIKMEDIVNNYSNPDKRIVSDLWP